jgi:sec-independent protein translocase protein TatC
VTLVEHLDELRRRLAVSVLAVVAGSAAALVWWEPILRLLLRPLPAEASALAVAADGTPRLAVTGVGEGFAVVLKLALAVGVALATPVWLRQTWAFVAPALRARERRGALAFTLLGTGLFVAGVATGFVTLRYPIAWLLAFGRGRFVEIVTADSYFTFVAYFLLVFGIAFELPLVVTGLVAAGVVSPDALRRRRAGTLVGLWMLACVATPGADPYSPLIVGTALTILYGVSEALVRAIRIAPAGVSPGMAPHRLVPPTAP